MLSIVATRRRAISRSGEIRPIADHAPVNSSISAIKFRIAAVSSIPSVRITPSSYTSISIHLEKHLPIHFSIHFHPIIQFGIPPAPDCQFHSSYFGCKFNRPTQYSAHLQQETCLGTRFSQWVISQESDDCRDTANRRLRVALFPVQNGPRTDFESIRNFPLQKSQFEAPFFDMFSQAPGLKIIGFWNQRLKRNPSSW